MEEENDAAVRQSFARSKPHGGAPIRKRLFPLFLCLLFLLLFPVAVSASSTLAITKQPENISAPMGAEVCVSVSAQGEGLQYQWYFKNTNRNQFYPTLCTDPTYTVTMSDVQNGRQVFCAISDQFGNYLQSKTATLCSHNGFQKELYKLRPEESLALIPELFYETDEPIQWRSSDTRIATVNEEGQVTGIEYGTVMITGTGTQSGFRVSCNVKVCDLKRVALTFDDGPSIHTSRLLDFLEEHEEVKVTFFMLGSRLNYQSQSVQRMAQQGHELAYHSYRHQTQTYLSDAGIISDFEKSAEILKGITDQPFTLWRTPGGTYNSHVLECIPLPHIMWSVDTRDWATRSSSAVYYSILNNSKNGSIVLLHDLHKTTVDGAIRAIEDMCDDDYVFMTVTELLSFNGISPEPHNSYSHG